MLFILAMFFNFLIGGVTGVFLSVELARTERILVGERIHPGILVPGLRLQSRMVDVDQTCSRAP
jgi:hypothetical protein